MQTYRVTFKRIGRTHDAPKLLATVDGPNHLADLIYQHARPYLRSSDVRVVLEEDLLSGWIFCGFQTGGTFTIEAVEPAGTVTSPNPSEAREGR